MSVVTFRGFRLSDVTRDQILEAERLAGFRFVITQGSFNTGVEESAGSHDKSGAVDFRVRDLTDEKIKAMLRATRTVGLWTWLRLPSQGPWPKHVHGITLGDPNLSAPVAVNQEKAAYDGFSGLGAGGRGGPDPHTGLGIEPVTWKQYQEAQDQPEAPDTVEAQMMLVSDSTGGKHKAWYLLTPGGLLPVSNDEAKSLTGVSRTQIWTTPLWRRFSTANPVLSL